MTAASGSEGGEEGRVVRVLAEYGVEKTEAADGGIVAQGVG